MDLACKEKKLMTFQKKKRTNKAKKMDKLIKKRKNGPKNELFPSNMITSVIIYHVCT